MADVMEEMVTVRLTIPRNQQKKLYAFMQIDAWEEAEKVRQARIEECTASLKHAVHWALHERGSGAMCFAQCLASLYNGERVKADLSSLFSLDMVNREHMLNVFRLVMETHREPHTFFSNGNELFEKIISDWGFEKKRRARHD